MRRNRACFVVATPDHIVAEPLPLVDFRGRGHCGGAAGQMATANPDRCAHQWVVAVAPVQRFDLAVSPDLVDTLRDMARQIRVRFIESPDSARICRCRSNARSPLGVCYRCRHGAHQEIEVVSRCYEVEPLAQAPLCEIAVTAENPGWNPCRLGARQTVADCLCGCALVQFGPGSLAKPSAGSFGPT